MKVVSLSALRTGRLYPLNSFRSEAESTPGPQCGWKDYVNEPATFRLVAQSLNGVPHFYYFGD